MKRGEVGDEFAFYTGKLSEVVRQLAFVGFACIWLFKKGTDSPSVPREFRSSAVFLLLALIFDFAQYAWGAAGWSIFKENIYRQRTSAEDNIIPPWKRLYLFPYLMLALKSLCLIIGYCVLLYTLGYSRNVFADKLPSAGGSESTPAHTEQPADPTLQRPARDGHWVLWRSPRSINGVMPYMAWYPEDAFLGRAACHAALDSTLLTMRSQGAQTDIDSYRTLDRRGDATRHVLRCLPETVDPRERR